MLDQVFVNERREIQVKKKENREKKVIKMEKLFRKGFPTSSMRWQSMIREDFLNANAGICMVSVCVYKCIYAHLLVLVDWQRAW
jgi:hypothetical protein